MSESEDKKYERSFPREPVRVKAEIMKDGHWHDCVITNFSREGARLYLAQKVASGAEVAIKINETERLNTVVIWAQGYEIGVMFNHEGRELEHVLAKLQSST